MPPGGLQIFINKKNPSLNYNDDFLKDDNDTFSLAAHLVDQQKTF